VNKSFALCGVCFASFLPGLCTVPYASCEVILSVDVDIWKNVHGRLGAV